MYNQNHANSPTSPYLQGEAWSVLEPEVEWPFEAEAELEMEDETDYFVSLADEIEGESLPWLAEEWETDEEALEHLASDGQSPFQHFLEDEEAERYWEEEVLAEEIEGEWEEGEDDAENWEEESYEAEEEWEEVYEDEILEEEEEELFDDELAAPAQEEGFFWQKLSQFIGPQPMAVPPHRPLPFARLPQKGSYWPIVGSHHKGREVAYAYQDKGRTKYIGRRGRRFLASRAKGKRYHAGVDLWGYHKDKVVAIEDGKIVNFYYFYRSTYCILIDHGDIVINYGEVEKSSLKDAGLKIGSRVKAGQMIGRVGKMTRSSMLHLEIYRAGTRKNYRYYRGKKAPPALLNPTRFLLALKAQGVTGGKPAGAPSHPKGSPNKPIPRFRINKARRLNGIYSRKLGWKDQLKAIGLFLLVPGAQVREARLAKAIARFQHLHQLSVDGIMGPQTWKKMAPLLHPVQAIQQGVDAVKSAVSGLAQAWSMGDQNPSCTIQDLTDQAKPRQPGERGKPYGTISSSKPRRRLDEINAIVLHHMAVNPGNDISKYYKVGAHYVVLQDGQIGKLYDHTYVINASHGFNYRSIAIEFAGNFPNADGKWWYHKDWGPKTRRAQESQLTEAQMQAGRCLLRKLKEEHPGIQFVYAHRQSATIKRHDPGPDVWRGVGEWAKKQLGLSDGGPGYKLKKGLSIPESWR